MGPHSGRWNAGEASKFAVPHRGIGVLDRVRVVRSRKVPFLTFPGGSGRPTSRFRHCPGPLTSFHFRLLGGSWGDLGAILGALGPILGALESILAALESILGAFQSILGDLGPISDNFYSFFDGFRPPEMTKALQNMRTMMRCLLNGTQIEKLQKNQSKP